MTQHTAPDTPPLDRALTGSLPAALPEGPPAALPEGAPAALPAEPPGCRDGFVDGQLGEELVRSGYLHRPLPLHPEHSLEALVAAKPALTSRVLWAPPEGPALGPAGPPPGWRKQGAGTLSLDGVPDPAGRISLRMELPTVTDHWPGEAPDGDYTPFCRQQALLELGAGNWEAVNRIRFMVYPDCAGARTVNLALIFANEGRVKVPDPYGREGYHQVNLLNRRWNTCVLEIPELPRDRISMIGFESAAYGRDRSTGETLRFHIGEIRLERVASPEPVRGWRPGKGRIAYAMAGYEAAGPKTALMAAAQEDPQEFSLADAEGAIRLRGRALRQDTPLGSFDLIDFSSFRSPGLYTLRCGPAETRPFPIGQGIWGPSLWKALNFIFCERCGYPVPEKHGLCHGDVAAAHGGRKLIYNGGWHDAGDLSQQSLQTAETAFSLLEMARTLRQPSSPGGRRDSSPGSRQPGDAAMYPRLLEEAEWGLDFILKCRFGDGYRASSAGLVDWTDGFIGTMDDRPARVHNNSFDNFICAALEAFAAETLVQDPMLCERLAVVAEEDFGFALAAFRAKGFRERPLPWEHSYPTSPSLHQAAMSWSASLLYRLSGKAEYAALAAEAFEYVMSCQRTEPLGAAGLQGFFYRDKTRQAPQHFNHQSRDQLYMQALALLLETQGNAQGSGQGNAQGSAQANAQGSVQSRWRRCAELYGGYLRGAAGYTAPWGMLPSGVYQADEGRGGEDFERQHPQLAAWAATESAGQDAAARIAASAAQAAAQYRAQYEAGTPLDAGHALRIFPVWFSFRGNSAVHLATGKAAALCGKILGDNTLIDMAREQLYWVLGKNPFCQSLMYGEGHNYPEQAVYLPGTMTGQLPVGIGTRGPEDLPYWPQANNATYKEAWVTVASKWLSLVAELALP